MKTVDDAITGAKNTQQSSLRSMTLYLKTFRNLQMQKPENTEIVLNQVRYHITQYIYRTEISSILVRFIQAD